MKCPVCNGVDLVMTERQEVEIDYCPQCRGVWLDRGELDKIIERSGAKESPPPPAHQLPGREYPHQYPRHDSHHHDEHHYQGHHRKKSWLSDLFD